MNQNSSKKSAVNRRNILIFRFVALPLCFLGLTALSVMCFLKPPSTVPTSNLAGEKNTQSVLSNFSDDLGAATELKFTTVTKTKADLAKGSLILVNPKTIYPFPETDTLVNVYDNGNSGYLLPGTEILLQKEVLQFLNSMMEEFSRITGCDDVLLSDGYRSESLQAAVYEQAKSVYGDTADQVAAQPGYSEFHTGYAVSFDRYTKNGTVMELTSAAEWQWLPRNCARFGFILRYLEGKSDLTGFATQPYHYRYVGKPHAYLMNLKQYCLEEYLEYLSHYTFGGSHVQVTDNENNRYEIYYVPASGMDTTEVPVPIENTYTISGDNQGGFIVTVLLKG